MINKVERIHLKDTPIEWIGSIPKDWNVIRMRFICDITTGNKDTENKEDNGEYPFFVRADKIENISTYSFDGEGVLTAGDGVGVARVFHYYVGKFDFHQRVYLFYNFRNVLGKYFFYYIKYNLNKEVLKLSAKTTVDSLRLPMLQNFPFVIPPITEQKQISNFLDTKISQIDSLISKKQELIKKLKEKRIALITEAVTKGVDDLSPTKDSDIQWLGNIPQHWEVKRLRFLINSNPVKSEVSNLDDELEVSFLPMEAINEYGGISYDHTKIKGEVYNGYTFFRNGDVLLAKITPCFENGKGTIVNDLTNGIGFGTTELHVMRVNGEIDIEYLFYLSISDPFRKLGSAEMLGAGGQKRVPEEFIKDFKIGFPELSVQKQIVAYLKKQLSKLDKLISLNEKSITKLEEYRIALITNAVTGKIDIKN